MSIPFPKNVKNNENSLNRKWGLKTAELFIWVIPFSPVLLIFIHSAVIPLICAATLECRCVGMKSDLWKLQKGFIGARIITVCSLLVSQLPHSGWSSSPSLSLIAFLHAALCWLMCSMQFCCSIAFSLSDWMLLNRRLVGSPYCGIIIKMKNE